MIYLTNFFLFILSSDTKEIFELIDIFKNLNNVIKIDYIIIMRENFGKFYNMVDKNTINQLIKLSLKDNIDKNIDSDKLLNLIDRLIKYSDNINLIDFVKEYFSYNLVEAKKFIIDNCNVSLKKYDFVKNKKITSDLNNKLSILYDDKNTIYNLKHNLIIFWLTLTNLNKQKIFDMEENYFTNKLNKNEYEIVFGLNKIQYQIPIIDYFNPGKKNVIKINKNVEYQSLNKLIEIKNEKNRNITVDTIIIESINLSEQKIEIPFDIKNIKIIGCDITNLDFLHENIEIIDCSHNDIIHLDNLPKSVKILICHSNKIISLDNLPNELEYLDTHYNKIQSLNNLPQTLKYLKCSSNELEYIDNLPNELVYLDCSYNYIKTWIKLPDHLESFICKSNKLEFIEELKFPFGIKNLHLVGNRIKCIYSLNSNIKELYLTDKIHTDVICYDTPNMMI